MKSKNKGILIGIVGTVVVAGIAFTGTALAKNGVEQVVEPDHQQEQLTPEQQKTAISSLVVNNIADQTYTGEAITPAVIILDGTKQLVKDTDFTLAYSKNTNVGIADIVISAKGNDYEGEKTIHFNIVKRTNSWVEEPDVETFSAGEPAFGTVEAYIKAKGANDSTYIRLYDVEGDLMPDEEDFDAIAQIFYGGQEVTVKVVVPEGDTYLGLEEIVNFTVPMDAFVEDIEPQIYKTTPLTPEVVVKDAYTEQELEEGVDYTVAYTNNVNTTDDPTFGIATITFIGDYEDVEPIVKQFTIKGTFNFIAPGPVIEIDKFNNITFNDVQTKEPTSIQYGYGVSATSGATQMTWSDNPIIAIAQPGIYDVAIKTTETDNYTGTMCRWTNMLVGVDIPIQHWTGQAIEPTVVIPYNGNNLVEGTDYTVSYYDNTNVGMGIAEITFIGDYARFETAIITFIIEKAENSFTTVPVYSFNGLDVTITTPGVTEFGTVEYYYIEAGSDVWNPITGGSVTLPSAGTYTFVAVADGGENYWGCQNRQGFIIPEPYTPSSN